MSKIQKQSRRVRILFQSLFVITPFTVCYYWLTVDTQYDFFSTLGIIQSTYEVSNYRQLPLTMTTRVLACVTSLLLSCIIMYSLKVLILLFKNYENNEIFSLANTKSYQKLGYSLFYWVGGSIIYGAIMSVLLSFNNPPGERILAVGFDGMDFMALVLGFIVLIISWVMKEGFLLAEENTHTI